MRIFWLIIAIIIIIIGVTFAIINANSVTLNYYFGKVTIALSLLLAFTLVIGIILGLIGSLFPIIRLKKKCFQLKHKNKNLEKEISNLRQLSIHEK